jgi:hypothetical protein
MLRTTLLVVVCAFCAGAGSTALWAKGEPRAQELRAAAAARPSIEELHVRAGILPDRTVREPHFVTVITAARASSP